jgi:hypothetical protein
MQSVLQYAAISHPGHLMHLATFVQTARSQCMKPIVMGKKDPLWVRKRWRNVSSGSRGGGGGSDIFFFCFEGNRGFFFFWNAEFLFRKRERLFFSKKKKMASSLAGKVEVDRKVIRSKTNAPYEGSDFVTITLFTRKVVNEDRSWKCVDVYDVSQDATVEDLIRAVRASMPEGSRPSQIEIKPTAAADSDSRRIVVYSETPGAEDFYFIANESDVISDLLKQREGWLRTC